MYAERSAFLTRMFEAAFFLYSAGLSFVRITDFLCHGLFDRLAVDMAIHGYIHVWISDLGHPAVYPWILCWHIL